MNTNISATTTVKGGNSFQTTMSSVELVEVINSMRKPEVSEIRHNNFMAKIEKVLGVGALNFQSTYLDASNRQSRCYNLPKREAELMVMSESYEVQAKVYDRMTELATQITPVFALPNFLDPAEAAIAWATEYKAKENALAVVEAQTTLLIQQIDKIAVQAKKIVTQAPDVDFVARYVTGEGNKTFRCVAKLLNIKENAFRAFLVDNKIMYKLNKEWMPCSGYKRSEYFEVKTDFFYGTVCSTTLFTPAGIVWVAKQYTKALLRDHVGLKETIN